MGKVSSLGIYPKSMSAWSVPTCKQKIAPQHCSSCLKREGMQCPFWFWFSQFWRATLGLLTVWQVNRNETHFLCSVPKVNPNAPFHEGKNCALRLPLGILSTSAKLQSDTMWYRTHTHLQTNAPPLVQWRSVNQFPSSLPWSSHPTHHHQVFVGDFSTRRAMQFWSPQLPLDDDWRVSRSCHSVPVHNSQ